MKKVLLVLFVLLLLGCGCACAETTTTVLMYMCGTDLQSDCLRDLGEMCSVDLPDSVNIVVQAGGASQWDDDQLTPNAINRFTIEDQEFANMQVLPSASMGERDTLMSFLEWAVPYRPADRYMLVLWDHGGGSENGICFDETFDFDFLSVHEVNDALYYYIQANPDFHLDVIGFDACLMATYEFAAHMAHYGTYMIASEELEPWLGWNYAGWLEALAKNPDMDSQTLSVAVADAYIEACMDYNPDSYYSLSVTYLPAVIKLTEYMENYAALLADALANGQIATFSRARQRMYSFGSFYEEAASTNMVDFMAFLDATRQFAPNVANMVESAYRKAMRYSIGTDMFDYLTGLTILMPANNLDEFDRNYAANYDCTERLPNYCTFVKGYAAMLSGSNYVFNIQAPTQLEAELAAQSTFTGNLQSIAFTPSGTYVAAEDSEVAAEEAAQQDEEEVSASLPEAESDLNPSAGLIVGAVIPSGDTAEPEATDTSSVYACSMTLSPDELANLGYAEGVLYMDASDEESTIYIEMGLMQSVGINWETGDIVSQFDGTWPMLSDQLVVLYDQVVTGSMRRSIIPVRLNDVDGYLQIMFTAAHPEGVISGFTQGFDSNGLPVRGGTKLQEGDVLIPTYPMLYADENGEMQKDVFDGDPITVGADGALPFEFVSLEGSETSYMYCFRLTDIFGESQNSEFITFEL